MLTSLSHADELLQAPWLLTWSGSLVLADNVAHCENSGYANPDARVCGFAFQCSLRSVRVCWLSKHNGNYGYVSLGQQLFPCAC